MKNDKQSHPNTDGSISDIENRFEKSEFLSAPNREPFRKNAVPNREIKHIDYMTVKARRISPFCRKEFSNLTVATRKKFAVKNRIDDVAHSPGKNQGNRGNQNPGAVFSYRIPKPVANGDDCHEAESRQNGLAVFAGDFRTPGHAPVFHKQDFEPIENR